MRNLAVLAQRTFAAAQPSSTLVPAQVQATACSLDDDTIYAVSVSRSSPTSQNVNLSFLRSNEASSDLAPFASILAPAAPAPLPDSARSLGAAQRATSSYREIVSFHYLADGGSTAQNGPALCTITAGGDLIVLPLNDTPHTDETPDPDPEIVGSVEQGILAAAWSPDDEVLVLVTAESPEESSESRRREGEKVLLMTREFEVLSEALLRTDEFGEEKPVDVGWGSKATQFHGSEGKAAAAAAAAAAQQKPTKDTRGPQLLDDDGRPRISWRGDGAFFAISALEPFRSSPSEVDAAPTWHRLIRTYARLGALSATSDPSVRGISQALAFRPIGNLIASTQRFGPSPFGENWAQGRAGRHDVVFFERNGLRHGEFSLREEGAVQPEGDRIGWAEAQALNSWSRDHYIRELCWNSDGTALAVWLSRYASGEKQDHTDAVQIWTTGNYHWYLKQEMTFDSRKESVVQQLRWHPERPHELLIATSQAVFKKIFCHETSASGGRPPFDAACVAVADGSATLLTPFRMQNVPPPMCSLTLLHPPPTGSSPSTHDAIGVPLHYSWTQVSATESNLASSLLGMLFQSGDILLWRFDWGNLGAQSKVGGRPVAQPRLIAKVNVNELPILSGRTFAPSQISIAAHPSSLTGAMASVAVLGTDGADDSVHILDVPILSADGAASPVTQTKSSQSCTLPHNVTGRRRLFSDPFMPKGGSTPNFYVHNDDGETLCVSDPSRRLARMGDFCTTLQIIARPGGQSPCAIGLALNGKLFANSHLVAKDATSFALAGSFLVWTNSAHEARFLPIASLPFEGQSINGPEEAVDLGRRVERGSRIVTAVPSMMALVLQMPRGNLETICPRPLVLEFVRRDLDHQRYGSAFRTCRTHRMDVNILYDHDPQSFVAHIDKFVQQVADVDHINLFLSGLRNEDVTTTLYKPILGSTQSEAAAPMDKVNQICDAVRAELERIDKRKYINSILTTHVRKVPADYEAGLSLLLELKAEDQELAEEAVKYIIFLADADKLFDLALGMYDFTLTLMVAQHAQRKDPREYLPFLRSLRALEPVEYQRFRIDEHLKRNAKALNWLSRAGKEHHEAALRFMDEHRLYEEGLRAWAQNPSALRNVYELFGEYLMTRRKPADAAACFQLAGKTRRAIEAHREAGQWREAFALAFSDKWPAAEIVRMAREVTSQLEDRVRWSDAARVALDYARDIEQAVHFLCRGSEFSEARRLAATYARADLIDTHIAPAALESTTAIQDDLEEMREQLTKQMDRIRELRERKAANPAMFYGEDDPALENVEVMSDTSTQMTQFTRYTAAPSATASTMSTFSQMSKSTNRKQLAKMKKKEERKKAGGKKGSIYEEDYLYESVQKLIRDRLGGVQSE